MMSTPSPRSLKIAPPKVAPNSFPACNLRDSSCVRLSSRSSRSCLPKPANRSEEHTSELQSREKLVCRLLLEKKKSKAANTTTPIGQALYTDRLYRRMLEPVHFFFNDTATTEIYTLSLHDALPI